MATDIRLDDDPSEQWVTVDAGVLNVSGSDLLLHSAARRRGGAGLRRALVHDASDGLTVNFNRDYAGGVTINDASVNLRSVSQGSAPQLPKAGTPGDLLLTHNVTSTDRGDVVGESHTLWLCVGQPAQRPSRTGAAYWIPVSTGDAVAGSV